MTALWAAGVSPEPEGGADSLVGVEGSAAGAPLNPSLPPSPAETSVGIARAEFNDVGRKLDEDLDRVGEVRVEFEKRTVLLP